MDACRTLRVSLALPSVNTPIAPLLVVSLASDWNCALVVAGLALALAEEERRTVLVDANVRQPMLHSVFSLPRSPGFSESLDYPSDPPACFPVRDHLWLLSAGSSPRAASGLLSLPSAVQVTRRLAEQFDAVVYHTVYQASLPDALLLAAHVKTAILLVQSGVDAPQPLRRAKERLSRAGLTLLGFALVE